MAELINAPAETLLLLLIASYVNAVVLNATTLDLSPVRRLRVGTPSGKTDLTNPVSFTLLCTVQGWPSQIAADPNALFQPQSQCSKCLCLGERDLLAIYLMAASWVCCD